SRSMTKVPSKPRAAASWRGGPGTPIPGPPSSFQSRNLSASASGERGFAVRLGAKDESTTGDAQWPNTDKVLFGRRGPGQQLCVFGIGDVVVGTQHASVAPDDHAPTTGNAVVVGLKQHAVVDRSADQLGALGGTEQHRLVLHDEINREDLRVAIHARDEPSQRDAGQQTPAFRLGQD